MKLSETPITGAWLLEVEPIADDRGFFARSLCVDTLAAHGLEGRMQQQSVSFNFQRGTLRGMHYQNAPHAETKLVRVTRGRVYDVMLDMRRDSPSFLCWHAVELSADNHRTLYIPKGVAHGFQTLENCSEVFYQMAQPYMPGYACGVRWNDPAFGIDWPLTDPVLSERDASYPDFSS
ncbi:dTDP-4-dehydrorhamnose 3,5-epimerase [Laribacter hongkongensis]|uniref:dTDP-4-dehydrorhamnose 3,5-epimerase n=1 Tax=Laribacter hongkongensis TaxID=168471 RepID=A0ABD4SSF3_9NEIS|nr:dTDP-4-dehydrorhamnose 3,5-epimerase [Laribacter hongkongensis]MCG9026142.1 dTDP-4-dehydrorhamnose 3,5-epimerase [Laribacter hongkongensis]MCG9101407.1 dTDP-4-dehydrorhamnose 3,5-epimerase [Laribacter hongkongensis]MCG9103655.1 dTDP-4-dehydrorhamnose 3,5-epimerase [Laribacter hongkongensis]MCG9113577.1 dTDP-4-dehydrorhamnose 3,5-epimerase [Laribacter hongkongensis]MCG9117584.1 dTDP-4-dehydrorhamnose 3,5-epimerase [Laribacter hongkongensis]